MLYYLNLFNVSRYFIVFSVYIEEGPNWTETFVIIFYWKLHFSSTLYLLRFFILIAFLSFIWFYLVGLIRI